jgi:hypothetical protein
MFYNGDTNANTKCKTGQEVLNLAIPTCNAGQVVSYNGTAFYCKTEVNVPTCTAGEFLTFNGTTYTCQSTGVATCGQNQVLTFNGASYFCVNRTDAIPVCGPNQFLTYNGAYSCATVTVPTIPNCPANYYVTGNGSTLYCAALPGVPNCGANEVVKANGGNYYCDAAPSSSPSGTICGIAYLGGYMVSANNACQGHNPAVDCPVGYHQAPLYDPNNNPGQQNGAPMLTCLKD